MSLPDSVASGSRRAGVPAWPVVVACLLIVLGCAGLWLASVHAFDIRVLLAMRHPGDPAQPLGPRWLQDALRDFVGLGGIGVLVVFIAGGIGIEWLAGRRRDAAWFLGGVLGAFVIGSALKHVVARPRPELVPHAAYTFTASFPSGNTLMATVVWLLLALALADAIGKCSVRVLAVAGALLIAFMVGVGRVYLGVHWPSDVIEAWGLGIAWVWLLCYARGRRLNAPR
jgi:undecaprenyl-diphosphatase